ncbi:MAG: hypothetical protein DMF49_09835 [Acidobacteria bacterium]|nr:MAG: hypothetical protein DMF49_09835 [Acidobacteriota bacterium]
MSSQTRLPDEEILRVGHPDDFSPHEVDDVIAFIDKEHYLKYPFNQDGSKNPYQYCYGLGYLARKESLWAAFVAGLYPNAGFWNEHFPYLVSSKGLPYIFRHAANIYRIVAFYQEDADRLLQGFERFCFVYRRTNILFALPTRKERDAVCNWDWFAKNGFKDYGATKNAGARIFAKHLDFEPIEYSPFEIERQAGNKETEIRMVHKRLEDWMR